MRSFKSLLMQLWQPSRQKWTLVAAVLGGWLGLGISFLSYGYEATWQVWGVPTRSPFFIDFRVLPAMVESIHAGFDPAVQNPFDPLQRPLNLPSVWRILRFTGLSQADTLVAGIVLLCLFFLGLCLFPGRLRHTDVIWLVLVAFSPAAMLLFERGNVDLFFFFLAAVAVATVQISAAIALFAIAIAALFKFFPFFGVILFMCKPRRVFLAILISSSILFGLYLLIASRDLRSALALTEHGADVSYGVGVLLNHFAGSVEGALIGWGMAPKNTTTAAWIALYSVALIIALVFGWRGLRAPEPMQASAERNLIAFWMGAGIYVGTFLLGDNWDYRLAFLLFVIPQLGEWMRVEAAGRRAVAWGAVILILLSCWYLFFIRFVPGPLKDIGFVADQLVKWSLFGALVYLLGASVPQDVRSMLTFWTLPRLRDDPLRRHRASGEEGARGGSCATLSPPLSLPPSLRSGDLRRDISPK